MYAALSRLISSEPKPTSTLEVNTLHSRISTQSEPYFSPGSGLGFHAVNGAPG